MHEQTRGAELGQSRAIEHAECGGWSDIQGSAILARLNKSEQNVSV